jgi:hypothetical protein
MEIHDGSGSEDSLELVYKVVCHGDNLYRMDLNMVVLFVLAVGIVYVAFHTPELYIVMEMTDEEL